MSEFKNFEPIYKAFGLQKLEELPVLDLKNRRGATDYIDFVKNDEMTSPIMKGIDCFKRPFLAIKVKCTYKTEELEPTEVVGTFFQRYTDDESSWAFGTCYMTDIIWHDSRVRQNIYSELQTRLTLLTSGKKINSIHSNCSSGDGNWILTLP